MRNLLSIHQPWCYLALIANVGFGALAGVTEVDALVETANAVVLAYLAATRCSIAVLDLPAFKLGLSFLVFLLLCVSINSCSCSVPKRAVGFWTINIRHDKTGNDPHVLFLYLSSHQYLSIQHLVTEGTTYC